MVRSADPSADSMSWIDNSGEVRQLAAWLQAAVLEMDLPVLRLAFVGRTSDDEVQDPTISIPRQLRSSRSILEPGMEIKYFFWDVETSRLDLDLRGSSQAWKKFDIDIPRDGGIADLLAEAARPDRRFDAVICESIDRIGRFSYQTTKIEHDLERLGVPLIAADEPIMRSSKTGKIERNAALTLLRRTKQGVAEWYVLEMLEKSRKGIEEHTDQGFNVGKPCYGYIGEKIKHPVPAKRAQGKHKTRLAPDPTRWRTVPKIYDLRVKDLLSYPAIAGVLNQDLEAWPPPQPVDPTRAVGHWTPGAVREILTNPKYTGFMVWNRRATKDKRHPGKNNPKDQWVMSPVPTHTALVEVETFIAAQALMANSVAGSGRRERHRAGLDVTAANPHPLTKTVYKLRSYVWCQACQRRMHGHANRHGTPYAYCQPRNRELPDDHPAAIRVREDRLIEGATRFFNTYVLGPDRLALVQASLPAANDFVRAEHLKAEAATHRRLAELDASMSNLMHVLERESDPHGQLYLRTKKRMAELESEYAQAEAHLQRLAAAAPPEPENNVGLLDHLPQMEVDLNLLPSDRLRRLLDAFRVEIHYDIRTGRATFRAEISAETINQLAQLISRAEARRWKADTNEARPAQPGGPQMIKGSSLSECPRRVPPNMGIYG